MNWVFLFFLGEPWFVVPWYAIGVLGLLFVLYDMRTSNTAVEPAMKWAWPIIVFFFSFVGLALYFSTARPPGVGQIATAEEKGQSYERYQNVTWRKVTGSAIHCVAGDGLGITVAMVIARAAGMSFWQEFWFEYVVGFAFGWFIFQRKSMSMMEASLPRQLGMAFRAEFFSMLTVMGGMGAVMTYVTPMVATAQPKPLTYAFWGFAMFGLLVGFALTYPMNWLLVEIGWKGKKGRMDRDKQQGEGQATEVAKVGKAGLGVAMAVLGCAALLLPAGLTIARERAPTLGNQGAVTPAPKGDPGQALYQGVRASLVRAIAGLVIVNRTQAALAMDDALRACETGAHSAPGAFYSPLKQIRQARIALQQGNDAKAMAHLDAAYDLVGRPSQVRPPILDVRRYRHARVINPEGALIGEVDRATPATFRLALGGWRHAFGFVHFGANRYVDVPTTSLAFGPPQVIGPKLVAVPTEEWPGVRAKPISDTVGNREGQQTTADR